MHDDDVISKKDVLARMGISYGQLYRWKRKGLIPESWFIRRSTFTGQETFFPKDRIIERIEQILRMKEDHALDDLAQVIHQTIGDSMQITPSSLARLGWVDDDLANLCGLDGKNLPVDVSAHVLLCLAALRRFRKQNLVTREELSLVCRTLDKASAVGSGLIDRLTQEPAILHVLRKCLTAAGISAEISLAVIAPESTVFDPEIELIDSVDLVDVLSRLKLDLAEEEA
ncbi:DUF4004 family protein [Candidatus Bipolaricaulota bacterium]|nr:DUF4004 family protein [Candidatus Bipolaricaulota bacterium]